MNMEDMLGILTKLVVLISITFELGEALVCLNCEDVADPRLCRHVTTCYTGEKCGMETFISHDGSLQYKLGCVRDNTCSVASTPVPSGSGSTLFYSCHDCCDDSNLCNIRGCNITGYPTVRGPICYNCEDHPSGYPCHRIEVCETHEVCYNQARLDFETNLAYNSGCMTKHNCADAQLDPVSTLAVGKRSEHVCSDCCDSDLCNVDCQTKVSCKDDPTCPLLLASYDICKTPTVATNLCPRSCNLCPQGQATPGGTQAPVTTAAPVRTTVGVITAGPTTQRPTTQRPTTQRPTTQRPTTQRPTTRRPITFRITTAPTTPAPTTTTTPKPTTTTTMPTTTTTTMPTTTTTPKPTTTPTTPKPTTRPTTTTPKPTTPTTTTTTPKPTTPTTTTTTPAPTTTPVIVTTVSAGVHVGSLVVRGPDWQYGNQDKGGLGQILAVGYPVPGFVQVHWITANVTNVYRMDYDGKYGGRFDVILYNGTTTASATTTPSAGVAGTIPTYGPALANMMYVGARVVRGVDWKWDDQDSHGEGDVIEVPPTTPDGWVRVRWDNGTANVYRMGVQGAYDLMFVPGPVTTPAAAGQNP